MIRPFGKARGGIGGRPDHHLAFLIKPQTLRRQQK
jgi:thiamine pyrophosphokinase